MTDPTPAYLEHRREVDGSLRDGAVPEAELADAIRARRPAPRRAGSWSVRWVRPVDAVAEIGSATAGRGIDLHRELALRLRHAPAALQPAVTDRIRSLGPTVRAVLPSRGGDQLERTR